MDKILDQLYLGDAQGATSKDILERVGITHILNISDIVPNKFPGKYTYKKVKVADSLKTNMKGRFTDILGWMDQVLADKSNKLLVHCYAGMSRSATAVIAYLMRSQGLSLEAAFNFCRVRRPFIQPNKAFMAQLKEYDQELRSGQDQYQLRQREQSADKFVKHNELDANSTTSSFRMNARGGSQSRRTGNFPNLVQQSLSAAGFQMINSTSKMTPKNDPLRMSGNSAFGSTGSRLGLHGRASSQSRLHQDAIIGAHKNQNYHNQRRGGSQNRPVLPKTSQYMVSNARRQVYEKMMEQQIAEAQLQMQIESKIIADQMLKQNDNIVNQIQNELQYQPPVQRRPPSGARTLDPIETEQVNPNIQTQETLKEAKQVTFGEDKVHELPPVEKPPVPLQSKRPPRHKTGMGFEEKMKIGKSLSKTAMYAKGANVPSKATQKFIDGLLKDCVSGSSHGLPLAQHRY